MYIVIKSGYTRIAVPVGDDIGKIISGMDGAISVSEPSWNQQNYKKINDESVTFTIVPDNMIGEGDSVVERYKEDYDRAVTREMEERAARKKAEEELAEMKKRFAPFLEEDSQANTEEDK